MKAVYIESHGGGEVLTYGDRPDPVIEPHEVRVQVRACALNRLDLFTRMGVRGMQRKFPPPLILGGDVAGDVVEVGSMVKTLRVGQRVVVCPRITCGQCSYCMAGQDEYCAGGTMLGTNQDGGYAEYTKVPGSNVFPIPEDLSYEEAAALPTVFMPMWNMLIRKTKLKAWETALVLSASSGVGTAAIQVAKKVIGARVIATTSSAEKALKAHELGADAVIDYSREDIAKRVQELTGGRGVDVVVDHVGSQFYDKAFTSLARGGRYGICGVTTGYRAELHMGVMFTKGLTVLGVFMGNKEDLRQIVEVAGRGAIRAVIDRFYPLIDAPKAHQSMESRNFFGKIVLRIP